MKRQKGPYWKWPTIVVVGIFTLEVSLLASGSYAARTSLGPKVQKQAQDRARYSLGKCLLHGQLPLKTWTSEESHLPRLTKIQRILPARIAKKTDVTQWSGKLSSEQLDALEYYVTKRYGKSQPNDGGVR